MCVFVGYDRDHKAYRLFDPRTQSVIVSNQVRFDERRFPFEEGIAIDPVIEKDFASGSIAGGVSGVPAVNTDDVLGTEDVSNDIPTPPISEAGSELPDESEDSAERLYQDMNAEISDDDHGEITETSSMSVPQSGSDSEWSPSVVVSEKNVWQPVSGRRAAKRTYSPSSSRESSPKAANRYLVLAKKAEQSVDQGRDEGNSDPFDNRKNDPQDIEDEMPLVPSGGGSVDNDESVMLVQSFSENNKKRLKGSVNLAASCFMAAERSVARGEIPKTFEQVLKSEEKDKWIDACQEEMDAHNENGTFEIVDAPDGRKPVGSRWVFTIKDDGRYKARLVAQGYSQKFGLDYGETFSPVIRYDSIKVLIGVAARFGLPVHQMDVKTAFLNR
jgi:hypothetical protein